MREQTESSGMLCPWAHGYKWHSWDEHLALPKPMFLSTMPRVRSQCCLFLHYHPSDFLAMNSCVLFFSPLSSFPALSTVHCLKELAMEIIWGPHAKLKSKSGKARLIFIASYCFTWDGKWRQTIRTAHLVPSEGITFSFESPGFFGCWGIEQCSSYLWASCPMDLQDRWEVRLYPLLWLGLARWWGKGGKIET